MHACSDVLSIADMAKTLSALSGKDVQPLHLPLEAFNSDGLKAKLGEELWDQWDLFVKQYVDVECVTAVPRSILAIHPSRQSLRSHSHTLTLSHYHTLTLSRRSVPQLIPVATSSVTPRLVVRSSRAVGTSKSGRLRTPSSRRSLATRVLCNRQDWPGYGTKSTSFPCAAIPPVDHVEVKARRMQSF